MERGAVIQPDTDERLDDLPWGWVEPAETALAGAANRASALLLIGLDGLAEIDDAHGHLATDAVVRTVTTVLAGAVRGTDVTGRYNGHGGDEFLVLLPARDRQLGEMIARRIRARIRRAIIPIRSAAGEPVVVTGHAVSVGGAVTDPTTCRRLSLTELLRQADAALLQARINGGDQIVMAGGRAIRGAHR